MSLVLSTEGSLYGGESDHDGPIREAECAQVYTHTTGIQKKAKPKAQDESLKPGTVKTMITAWPCSVSQMNAVEEGMRKLTTEDVSFKDKCFLLGDVHQLITTTSGISTPLLTVGESSRLEEDAYCAHIQAPEGVVSPGVELTLHYAVILEGPFELPKGYRRVSSVLFLHCNNVKQLQKELTLQLRHWADICRGKESGLCFMKANHELDSGVSHYDFRPLEGGHFKANEKCGTIRLKSHFCLLCTAIDESKGYTSDRCYAVLCCKRNQEFRICIVHAVPSWFEAIKEYYWREPGEDTLSYEYREFCFQDSDTALRYVYLSAPTLTASGVGWHCNVLQNKVHFKKLDVLENLKQSQKHCTAEMNKGIFPPSLKFNITYEDGKAHRSHKRKAHIVSLKGCDEEDEVTFEIVVFEPPLSPSDNREPVRTFNSTECTIPIEEESQKNSRPATRLQKTDGGKMMVQRAEDDRGRVHPTYTDGDDDHAQLQPFHAESSYGHDEDLSPEATSVDESGKGQLGSNETGPMEECNRMALISQENNLKLNVKLNMGLLDQLQMAAGGFLNEREVQAVQSKGNNAEQMGEVIHILLGKRNANFMIFCAKLRKSNNAVWADVLEGIAKPANLRGHSRRYVPGSSVSMPSGHGRLHNSCQVIPEETELARDQAVGTRAQTTPQ